jgi:hypothetical protein
LWRVIVRISSGFVISKFKTQQNQGFRKRHKAFLAIVVFEVTIDCVAVGAKPPSFSQSHLGDDVGRLVLFR